LGKIILAEVSISEKVVGENADGKGVGELVK
jgi:hypothetical protein